MHCHLGKQKSRGQICRSPIAFLQNIPCVLAPAIWTTGGNAKNIQTDMHTRIFIYLFTRVSSIGLESELLAVWQNAPALCTRASLTDQEFEEKITHEIAPWVRAEKKSHQSIM
jgi:hypothetical protein